MAKVSTLDLQDKEVGTSETRLEGKRFQVEPFYRVTLGKAKRNLSNFSCCKRAGHVMPVLADAAARRRTSRYPEIELVFSVGSICFKFAP